MNTDEGQTEWETRQSMDYSQEKFKMLSKSEKPVLLRVGMAVLY